MKRRSKLPKNLGTCPACGVTCMLARVTMHYMTVDCLLNQTAQDYARRGRTIARMGLPLERAPVGVLHVAPDSKDVQEPWRSFAKILGRKYPSIPVEGPWAPQRVVEVVSLCSGASLPFKVRAALVTRALEDPEFKASLQAARRLGGIQAIAAFGRR